MAYVVVRCVRCGNLTLAEGWRATRTCPYCGAKIRLRKAPILGRFRSVGEAREALLRMKLEG